MVGKSRLLLSARSCLRVVETTLTDGGASAGTGVERPLQVVRRAGRLG
jgi:hypothetical protein